MSSAFNNIVIYNGYPLSVAVAVGIHITLLVSLLYLQADNNVETIEFIQPSVIKSLFIDENPQVINQKNIERRRLERVEQQRFERQQDDARKEREADAAAQQRRQEQEAAKAKADAQELAKQQSALRDREEVERQLAQQQRREREQEQQQLEDAAADRQRQQEARERSEQQARESERASEAAANAARTEFELIQSAMGFIQQVVQENWSRPPSARNGMRTILQISMLPTGEVIDVTISQSSNDPAFDRAAETAAFRAAPFAELQSLPIRIFNDNFRSFSLTFQPEDLLN
ncbi:MAG: colicin import membrane protein [Pseudohongiellaceae bacterium]|jgi:colicin import membrane protein